MITKKIICLECGEEKTVHSKSAKFCSEECLKEYYKRVALVSQIPDLKNFVVIEGESPRDGWVLLASAIIRSAITQRDEIFIYDLQETHMAQTCCEICGYDWETLTIAYEAYKVEQDEDICS